MRKSDMQHRRQPPFTFGKKSLCVQAFSSFSLFRFCALLTKSTATIALVEEASPRKRDYDDVLHVLVFSRATTPWPLCIHPMHILHILEYKMKKRHFCVVLSKILRNSK